MFDLNNLKHVNDTYGHEKGDEFIQAFAYCLDPHSDEHSFLARYGGDEFIIIQENTTPEELKHMDLHLSTLVQEYNTRASLLFKLRSRLRGQLPESLFLMDDLINAADKNMYQDKFYKRIPALLPNSKAESAGNSTVSSNIFRRKSA